MGRRENDLVDNPYYFFPLVIKIIMTLLCRRRRSTTAVGGSGYFALLLLVNAINVAVVLSVVVVVAGSSTPLSSIARGGGVNNNWKSNHRSFSSSVAAPVDNGDNDNDSNNNKELGPIFTNALLRGGGAAAAARKSKFSISNSSSKRGLLWRDDWNGSKFNIHAEQMVRQKLNQLEKIQLNTIRQLRDTIRMKQKQFQNSIYVLNSKLDSNFPRPPYSILWQFNEPNRQQISQGKTTITGNIFLLNIAIFGLQTVYPQLTALGAKRSDLILNGRQLHRLITPIFLHGGIGHLVANSYSLKSMGMNVETAFGRSRLLYTYLISGITGNFLSALQSPKPAVGASGAIFGLVGAYFTFLSRNQDLLHNAEYQKNALIETIGLNILLGLTNPMIDNWGHLGGFIGGVGMSYLIGPKLYVARVPSPLLLGGSSSSGSSSSGSSSSGEDWNNEIASSPSSSVGISLVIDRPMFVLRSPEYLNDGLSRLTDNVSTLGRNVKASLLTYFNNENRVQEYYYDGIVDNIKNIVDDSTGGDGDGTIYRVLKDDSLRNRTQQREGGRTRMKTPREGRSIRPKYSHMY